MVLSLVAGILFCLVLILMTIQMIMSGFSNYLESQIGSLESGFELIKSSPIMSSSFFLLVVLFVLFDSELVLLLPLVIFMPNNSLLLIKVFILLVSLVSLTLMMEWFWYGLSWQV